MPSPFIVVLEGPDGAGKSTIAQSILFQHSRVWRRAEYIHNDKPRTQHSSLELYREYMGQLKRAVVMRDRGVSTVIDRSFLSEVIYGPIYRGGSLITGHQRRKLENYARRHGIHLISVQAPLEVRRKRIEERGEPYDFHAGIIGMTYEEYFETHKVWKTADSLSANTHN